MENFSIFALLCALAVATGSPTGLANSKRVVFLGKNEPISTKPSFKTLINTRIVNGQAAKAGQFPHQVALILTVSEGTKLCGGTVITDTWILSAAHCVIDILHMDVVLGSLIVGGDEHSVTIVASMAHHHSDYNPVTFENDVAVIELSQPALMNKYVRKIPLNKEKIPAGQDLYISGYGKISDASASTFDSRLMYAKVQTISNEQCADFYRTVPDGVLCTVGEAGESSCSGDSGGPMILVTARDISLVGITSFGSAESCEEGYPVAYTRVSDYYNWIQESIGSNL